MRASASRRRALTGFSPFWLLLLMFACLVPGAPADDSKEPGTPFFRTKIEPVLRKNCYRCHSASAQPVKAGLRLDSPTGLRQGGDSGPAVVPGKSDESLLLQAIRHEDGLSMPPRKPRLPDDVIANFARWVDMGAPDPRSSEPAVASVTLPDSPSTHWAFRAVKKPELPDSLDKAWVRTPVDAFILANLEDHHWAPAQEATRSEWIRRVSFDLIGLPPTPEEVEAFEKDRSPAAYERVVDRLLASSQYGERWAQHWLDVVRYAETEGFEYDRHVPDAWRYRDYVIDAFNHDKPFDRFIIEQVAGDELAPSDNECLTASIFHRLGPVRRNAGNPELALSRNEVLAERTDMIGSAFLGLTIGCARCHDHKLEPISQKDYYRFQAYLAAAEEHNVSLAPAEEQRAHDAKSKAIKDQLQALKEKARHATGAEKERLKTEIEELEDQEPAPLPTIPSTWNDFEHRTEIHVLKRGVWERKGERVGPRPPSVLVAEGMPELPPDVRFPRTRLALWLTDPGNPLPARVIVNRLWKDHFSLGLVKTENDFGTKGDRPSHPELLDWLAATLIENGWREKPIHRLIVLSSTYRQSSKSPATSEAERSDPEDRLLWKFPRRRLEAEEIRDAMLAVSGRLNPKTGGPSVMIPVDPELVRLLYKPSQWKPSGDTSEYDRRSIYLIAKRNLRLPFMEAFDAPALMSSCARRESSTHAPQALELLNGRISNDLARAFAERLERETRGDLACVIEKAFRLALGRPPTDDERSLALAFLKEQPLHEFTLAMFNMNGFLYVP